MSDDYFVHASSIVDAPVSIDSGTKIWQFCHISAGAKIGQNCNVGQNCYIGKNVIIGSHCKLQNNVSIYQGVELEDYVFCGPSMVFTNDLTPRCLYPKAENAYKKTLVKRGATLGANCTIVCNTTIGSFALVGAGSVVTKDVPDYAIVVGNPARIVGYACECGKKLCRADKVVGLQRIACPDCKKQYAFSGDSGMKIVKD